MHSLRFICALVFSVVLLLLAALHIYWALGGKWGSLVSVPTIEGRRTMNPTPAATWLVATLLVLGAVIVCGRAGMFATGSLTPLYRFGSWVLCGVFLLRTVGNLKTFGIFKTVRDTPFAYWDTRLYSPLCFILAVLAGVVAAVHE